jgi:hypothetical protein
MSFSQKKKRALWPSIAVEDCGRGMMYPFSEHPGVLILL